MQQAKSGSLGLNPSTRSITAGAESFYIYHCYFVPFHFNLCQSFEWVFYLPIEKEKENILFSSNYMWSMWFFDYLFFLILFCVRI